MESRSSKRFFLGTVCSFSFSIGVILSTIGLMDGFEKSLKNSLAQSNGDITFSSKESFFLPGEIKKISEDSRVKSLTSILQVEAFAIVNDESKGILLKGVTASEINASSGVNLEGLTDGVFIGSELQQKYNLEIGNEILLALASNKSKNQGTAILRSFKIDGFIKHGIYEKDLRFIYIDKEILSNVLNYTGSPSNMGIIKLNNREQVEGVVGDFRKSYFEKFRFDPYWTEFEVLLDAVEVEKISISIVLQLIVVVAILNIVAFIFFISEIKSQDFFMLRALGLSLKSYKKFWFILLILIWLISCVLAWGMVWIFNKYILAIPFLQIPGEIYVLNELQVVLDLLDYLFVYGVSFVWIFIIGIITIKKLEKKSLVSGLRQEFS